MLEFRSGGRRVSQNEFFENLQNEAIEAGMKQLEQRVHDAAPSIIDPETGKHAEVFVRRRSREGWCSKNALAIALKGATARTADVNCACASATTSWAAGEASSWYFTIRS
jgi:hypothetical protein